MRPSEPDMRSAALAWGVIGTGLAAALGLLLVGKAIANAIPVSSLGAAVTLFYVLLFGPLIVLPLIIGALEKRKVWRTGWARGRWTLTGFVMGLGGLLVCVAYAWLHGVLVRGSVEPVVPGYLLLGLSLTLLQVSAEEVMFRGWAFPALAERVGLVGGIALSSLAFAAFHLLGGAEMPMSLFNVFLGGIWFALLAWRSGGLLAPIAAHFAWNVGEDLGFGLVPNPGMGELGALRNYDLVGSPFWGGAGEGFNASVVMTVVLVALIVPMAWPRPSAAVADQSFGAR